MRTFRVITTILINPFQQVNWKLRLPNDEELFKTILGTKHLGYSRFRFQRTPGCFSSVWFDINSGNLDRGWSAQIVPDSWEGARQFLVLESDVAAFAGLCLVHLHGIDYLSPWWDCLRRVIEWDDPFNVSRGTLTCNQ